MAKVERHRVKLRKPKHGGGLLQVGNPGNRGGGRRPEDFLKWLGDLLHDPFTRKRFEQIIASGNPEQFMKAFQWAAERVYGKPAQPFEHGGADGAPLRVTLDIAHDRE